MFLDKIQTLFSNLESPVSNLTPAGEYIIPFEDSMYVFIKEQKKHVVFWSPIKSLAPNQMEYSALLLEIGHQSMKLLAGLGSEFFPTPFIAEHELRLGIKLPINTNKPFLHPVQILIEDVGFWKKAFGTSSKPPIMMNHANRILKF